ncbi:MAG TPA: class I SAM-dependent methyltransferase [Actinophytocola sp.]|jgi:SAM-dependent methyltransferase|nr:class I SAM-dependent methyltransferase [Actinophytocola sp.]
MAEANFTVDDVDFDAFYQGQPPIKGAQVSFELAPWDIGAPQPVVVALADSGEVRDDVLDAGCGLGNNAIFLAQRGFRVTGVDGAQPALERARQRAADHGVEVEFVRADVTTLDGLTARYATVLDSALYHCLNDEQRHAYAAALHRVTVPGARLHLYCFADTGNEGLGLPMNVTQDDLRAHLAAHWDIDAIDEVDYTTSLTLDAFRGEGAERMRAAGLMVDPSGLRTDDRGRILCRAWQVRAGRT